MGARAGRGILRAAGWSGARAGESELSEPRASKPTITKRKIKSENKIKLKIKQF